MTPDETIRLLEQAAGSREARRLLNGVESRELLDRAFFDRVLELSGQDPSAAIRLSRNWSLVASTSGRPAHAIRARGVGERLRGQWAKSASTFIEAGVHGETQAERLTFQVAAVDSLARAGKVSGALQLGRRLANQLDELGESGHSARVKLNLGNACVWSDAYPAARTWLLEAIPDLERSGFLTEAASARLALSTAELFGGSPLNALGVAVEARSFFEAHDRRYYADLCAINIAHAQILMGRPDEALALLLELRSRLSDSLVDAARIEEYLGDAYLRLNLFEEAVDSYVTAGAAQKGKDMTLNRANCEYGLACAFLGMSDPSSAARSFSQATKRFAAVENRVWMQASNVGASTALRLEGHAERALRLVSSSVSELAKLRSRYHLALALLERAKCGLELGQSIGPSLERAYALIRSSGYVALEWEVHAVRAQAAPERQKLRHFRKAHRAILSARMLTRSDVGRSRFLRDKSRLLGDYVRHLLASPKAYRVAEALSVITETRSVALIDEILGAVPTALDAEKTSLLNSLRDELNASTESGSGSVGERRAAGAMSRRELRRKWIEVTTELFEASKFASVSGVAVPMPTRRQSDNTVAVFSDTGEEFFRIQGEKAESVHSPYEELRSRLKWLEFELVEPMVNPCADPDAPTAELASLASLLGVANSVSPDGVLWKVPWQALAHLEGSPEPVILPSPAFSGSVRDIELKANCSVGVWHFRNPALPHIDDEVRLVLDRFPDAEVCRTIDEVRACLDGASYDLLHVSGHARFNAENPMFSFLEVEESRIHAAEIARGQMKAGLVVLSACETGSLGFACKEEPEGLVRAFLARSASAVLGSAWVLDDEGALRFISRFYDSFAAGARLGEAVAAARSDCRKWRSHPYYWGPFAIFGGYAQ